MYSQVVHDNHDVVKWVLGSELVQEHLELGDVDRLLKVHYQVDSVFPRNCTQYSGGADILLRLVQKGVVFALRPVMRRERVLGYHHLVKLDYPETTESGGFNILF